MDSATPESSQLSEFALLDLDNTLVHGNSMERWCHFLVWCGLFSNPAAGPTVVRVEDSHDAHREGDIDHLTLVVQVGQNYANSMRTLTTDILELVAANWAEKSKTIEAWTHWCVDTRRKEPLYRRTYDARMPEPTWFAEPLTQALADSGAQPVLVSGGPTEAVSLFAQRFHGTVGGALTLEVQEDGYFSGNVVYNAGLPEEKRRIAAEYAAKGKIRFAAGDTPNDMALLERAEIRLIVGDAIEPPSSWTNVFRLPLVPTPEARRQLASLLRTIGTPQLTM